MPESKVSGGMITYIKDDGEHAVAASKDAEGALRDGALQEEAAEGTAACGAAACPAEGRTAGEADASALLADMSLTLHSRKSSGAVMAVTTFTPEEEAGNGEGRDGEPLIDASGRYERSSELLGRGASKAVYKAFDLEEGVERAWNELIVDHLSVESAEKIISEIQILTQLDNENIIKFYHSWVRPSGKYYDVFFITELMTSGTLKSYLQKTKGPIKLKVVKGWCRQILNALLYLHTMVPPIIHRDLKCDNIFINGNNGITKLGDFGLAVLKNREMLTSVLGTPEFMAPEMYEESYDEKVDVYSFGMCLLEMVTKDYPYSECDNAAQIYRKVTQGIQPMALHKVSDVETYNFIQLCIHAEPTKRPTVAELLEHEFMMMPSGATAIIPLCLAGGLGEDATAVAGQGSVLEAFSVPSSGVTSPLGSATGDGGAGMRATSPSEGAAGRGGGALLGSLEGGGAVVFARPPSSPPAEAAAGASSLCECHVEAVSIEGSVVNLRMRLVMSMLSGSKEVKFPFDFESDTVSAVVGEMVKEAVLTVDSGVIAEGSIKECLRGPLLAYERAKANAPARAEFDDGLVASGGTGAMPILSSSPSSGRGVPPSRAVPLASGDGTGGPSALPSVLAPPPPLGDDLSGSASVSSQSTVTLSSHGNNLDALQLSSSTSSPVEPSPMDVAIEDHPEVASMLLRQRKEIELLALFHRREYQSLIKTLSLRRQSVAGPAAMMHGRDALAPAFHHHSSRQDSIGGASSGGSGSASLPQMLAPATRVGGGQRSEQQASSALGQPDLADTRAAIFNNVPPGGGADESHFISRARRLMYESTGNSAWLPDGAAASLTPTTDAAK